MKTAFSIILIIFFLSLFLGGCGGTSTEVILPVPTQSGPAPTSTPIVDRDISWTVLIYLNGNSTLETVTDLKLKDLEGLVSSERVNILVQQGKLSLNGETGRYVISGNGSKVALPSPGVTDMASPQVLKDYIQWAKVEYPADYYILNIFSHAGGWKGLLRDHVSGNIMDISQLEEALKGEEIDIVSFSSCSMSTVEVAYQLRDVSNFLISSEDDVPVSGWPYGTIWNRLLENSSQDPEELSRNIGEDYLEYYRNVNMTNMTMSVIDLKKLSGLNDSLKVFSDRLIGNESIWQEIRSEREKSLLFFNKEYVDIETFFNYVSQSSNFPQAIREEAGKVNNSLKEPVLFFGKTEGSSNVKGLSLYFPDDNRGLIDFNGNTYSELDSGNVNFNWENFIMALYL